MITEMISAVVSWPTLGVLLFVFGFAPGAVLRLIALAFHRDDPRRQEMLAEVHAVSRLERPFWVAEQLEVAICEGLWGRVVWAATGRIVHRWHLESGIESNRKYPDTFWIPPDDDKAAIVPGVTVKLVFRMRDGWGEKMWVKVTEVKRRHIVGTLENQPFGIPRLQPGAKVKFSRDEVVDIVWSDDEWDDGDCQAIA